VNNYEILGVGYNADQRVIKKAYVALIKQYRPDSHPQEFARIRSAYEALLEQCRYQSWESSSEVLETSEVCNSESLAQEVQTEAGENDFNRLVDKPIIQLLEITNPQTEQLTTASPLEDWQSYSNLIDASNDDSNRLVDKPIIELLDQHAPNEDDLAWIQKPPIRIASLIEQLNSYKQPANEQAALTCFQSQLTDFNTMNIDQRMDYEEKLYDSLIYADHPALLVFAAACEYFDWTNNSSWIKTAQSKWSKQHFDALLQLSALYRQVCSRYNPYFHAQHDVLVMPHRLTTHYHVFLAQEQREKWFTLCQTANLTDLQNYFAKKPLHYPVYVIDVLFGGMLAYFGAILSYDTLSNYIQPSFWSWIMPLIVMSGGGLFIMLLLCSRILTWRMVDNHMTWKYKCILAIVLTLPLTLPLGLASKLISLGWFIEYKEEVDNILEDVFLFAFFGLILSFLYVWLAKLETFTTALIERIIQSLTRTKKPIQQTHPHPKILTPVTMNKQIYPLLIAQFLSAFADNAILFTVIAIVMKSDTQTSWYIPALQSAFLIAYVILGPWVGGIADRHAKARVLLVANIIKAGGAGLLLLGVEPLLAYGLVGAGAAIYSPAKYGILPELVGHDSLVKANSWIEGSTILAILSGMKIGAEVADHSTQMALLGTIVLFIVSALATLSLPVKISKKDSDEIAVVEFGKQMAAFFTTPRSRFAVLGGSLFWATAASLRVILIVWAPLVLLSKNASEIADLTLYLTVGIIVGSIIVPRLIPLEQLRRVRIPAYLMATLIAGLSLTTDTVSAQAVLFAIGMMGGLFIVPINAALQEQGQQTIGSGSAVALQNFFQNLAMLLAVGAYTLSAAEHIDPTTAMLTLGGLVFVATFLVSLCLPSRVAK
jgi:LPLT family lysophospholipid transporter-like MFS transporter